jgi:imidazolonepropionase-like amidohydrolase
MKIGLINCRLIDVRSGTAMPDGTVVIEGRHIKAAGPSASISVPPDAGVLDVAGRSVLPGLIDLHLHLTFVAKRAGPFAVEGLPANESSIALLGAWHMKQLLEAGVTAVRDVGSYGGVVFDLKWALDEGMIEGPRVWAAGRCIVPSGGHGSAVGLVYEADGADAMRRAVREEIKAGADLIKVACLQDEWSPDELQAAVDQAHRMGRKVACHVNYPPSIRNALDAGVDSIEHGCLVTGDELQQMQDQGTFWVVTSLIYREQFKDFRDQVADPSTPGHVAEHAREQVRRHEWIWENMPGAVLRAAELGVKIGAGSDMYFPHIGIAALPLELASLVEMGLSPARALQAATLTAAECIGCQDELGTVEAGKLADLIVVDGDPLSDISALQQVLLVIKDGAVAKDTLTGHH